MFRSMTPRPPSRVMKRTKVERLSGQQNKIESSRKPLTLINATRKV